MPKRHRQPGPINIAELGLHDGVAKKSRKDSTELLTPNSEHSSFSHDEDGETDFIQPHGGVNDRSDTSDSSDDEEISFDSKEAGDDGNREEDYYRGREFHRKGLESSSAAWQQQNGSYNDSYDDEEDEEDENDYWGSEGSGGTGEDADYNEEEEEGDEEEEAEEEQPKDITVNFGVFDLEDRHVMPVMHLLDQFCPDKMNEVDRDDLFASLLESPYTSIVKMNEDGSSTGEDEDEDEDEDEEEEEVCGLCSVLHFFNGLSRHPTAYKALEDIFANHVWRTVAPGILPLDLLRNKKEGAGSAGSNAKNTAVSGLLWVFEQIQTVPLELTIQLIDDTMNRLERDANERRGGGTAKGMRLGVGDAAGSYPCWFVLLAKVQRAAVPEGEKTPTADSSKERSRRKLKKKGAAEQEEKAKEEPEALSLKDYIFWREEDEAMFRARDTRVGAVAYRCRPQYDGQPEMERPLSLMFAIKSGAVRGALEELKKRASAPSSVQRFR